MEDLKNKEASDWSQTTGKAIIINTNKESELDLAWQKWEQMPKQQRRESDWKSMEIYGIDNKTRYERMKNVFNNKDIKDDPNKSYAPGNMNIAHIDNSTEDVGLSEQVEDDRVNFRDIHYPESSVIRAEKWQFANMIYIIRPMGNEEALDDLYNKFESMSYKKRQLSNDASIEIFNIDNKTHYEFLKSKYLKQDIDNTEIGDSLENDNATVVSSEANLFKGLYNRILESDDMVQVSEDVLKINSLVPYTILEKTYKTLAIKKAKDKLRASSESEINNWTSSDSPFFTSDELIDLGVTNNIFSTTSFSEKLTEDISFKDWFKQHEARCNGIEYDNISEYSIAWTNKLKELYYELSISTSEDKTNSIKQSILQLGWNPMLEFNQENRTKARDRITKILEDKNYKKIYDLSKNIASCSSIENIQEAESSYGTKSDVQPVFLVFIHCDNLINKVISAVTNSKWGHAAIGFDPSLKTLYSYNIKGNGFSIESIHRYTDVTKLRVFCVFAPKEAVAKMKAAVREYKNNISNTGYSLINLLTIPLKIKYKSDTNMVCSQFVDSILKISNMNFTKKDSSLVTPKDLHSKLIRNKNIYKIYDGSIVNYDPGKIKNFLGSIYQPLSESYYSIVEDKELLELVDPYINVEIIKEAKEFPVQFDDDGNLIIKKMNKLNFEEEYSKSHKLLLSYDKTGNTEGIKYELSKLWFMNQVIERQIHSSKTNKNDLEDLYKVRARILNDFNTYLSKIIDEDNNFNFVEYYNDSPFNDTKVKIKGSTLKYTIDYVKKLLLK